MKFEHKEWKLASKVAAVVALGALASAQTSQSGRGDAGVRKGQALAEVSMENDIRTPWGAARDKIILQRPDRGLGSLELVLKMRHSSKNLDALMPAMDDMETTLVLMGGTPGAVALIHLETQARALGTRIVGFFDEDGRFSAVLPRGFEADGILARGEEKTLANLRLAANGGRAVPASKRPESDDMDVGDVVEKAYHNWARYYAETYTNLQFKSGGKLRSAKLDDPDAAGSTSVTVSSDGLVIGGGHVQRGKVVDDDTDIGQEEEEVSVDLPNPVRGKGALGKIALQRPARPAIGGGHTLPGSGVDDDTDIGDDQDASTDLADPVGGKRAFGKIQLQRPQQPAQQDGHVLQRKL
jgi:hypothetical protein